MTPSELTVRKVSHHGRVREWTLNPVWVRLHRRRARGIRLAAVVPGDGRAAAFRSQASCRRRRRKVLRLRSPARWRRRSGDRHGRWCNDIPSREAGRDKNRNRVGAGTSRALDGAQTMETSMLSPDRISDSPALAAAASDYDSVRRAVASSPRNGASSRRSRRSRRPPASPRPSCIICSAAGPGSRPKHSCRRLRSTMRACCCATPRACSTPHMKWVCPAPGGCTTCSSLMRRCRPANGRPAAKGSRCTTASIPPRSASR